MEHALFHCKESRVVWSQAFLLFGIEMVMPYSGYDFLIVWTDYFGSGVWREFGLALWFLISWSIWKRRNKLVFEGVRSREDIIGYCIHMCWAFFKYKRRNVGVSAADIFVFPSRMLCK